MKIFSKLLYNSGGGRTSGDSKTKPLPPGRALLLAPPTPPPISMYADEHLFAPLPPSPLPSLLPYAVNSSSSSSNDALALANLRINRRRHSEECVRSPASIELDALEQPLPPVADHHHYHHHHHHYVHGPAPKLISAAGISNPGVPKGGKKPEAVVVVAAIEESAPGGQGHPLPAPSCGKVPLQSASPPMVSRGVSPRGPCSGPQPLLPSRKKGSVAPDTVVCSLYKQGPIQTIARFESPPSNLQAASHRPLPLYHSPPSPIAAPSRHPSDPIPENGLLNHHENKGSPLEAAIKSDTLCIYSNSIGNSSSSSSTPVAQLSPPKEITVGYAYNKLVPVPVHAASSQFPSPSIAHQLPQPSQPSKQHGLIRSSSTSKAPPHPLYSSSSNDAVTLSPSAHRPNLKPKSSPLPSTSVHSRSASTNSWPVNPVMQCPRKWTIGQKLGQGTFGTVYEGHNQEDGSFFAVKIGSEEHNSLETQQEVAVLSKLSHLNIVRYLGSTIENKHLYIFLELVRMGSLKSILKKFKCLDEKIISAYTRQILCGLEYLHSQNTIHRDIKCANILVDVNGQVKLADFGVAKMLDHSPAQSLKGTPVYMAPEVMKSKPGHRSYGFPADIWSLGCTVIEMADGKPPWSNLEGFGFIFKLNGGELPHIPEHLSLDAKDFISNCLKLQPERRWTASQLLQHPFVANAPESVVQPDLPFLPTLSHSASSPPHLGPKSCSTGGARRNQAPMA